MDVDPRDSVASVGALVNDLWCSFTVFFGRSCDVKIEYAIESPPTSPKPIFPQTPSLPLPVAVVPTVVDQHVTYPIVQETIREIIVRNDPIDFSRFVTVSNYNNQVDALLRSIENAADYEETDPVFVDSAAFGITSSDISNWNALTASSTGQWSATGNAIYYENGNVGIGTNSPHSPLHVAYTGVDNAFNNDGVLTIDARNSSISNSPAFIVRLPSNGQQKGFQIGNGSDTYAWASFEFNLAGSSTPGLALGPGPTTRDVSLYRSATSTLSLATANQSRLTINSVGNVGIGTTSPTSLLHVAGKGEFGYNGIGSNINMLKLTGGAMGAGTDVTFMFEVNDTDTAGLSTKNLTLRGASSMSDLVFGPSTTHPSLLMLDGSSGNVGIGTTTPQTLLHLSSSAATLRLQNSNTSAYLDIYNTGNLARFDRVGPSDAFIDLNPMPQDGVSPAFVRLFRNTSTTNTVGLQILAGNGTTDVNSQIGGKGNSYFNALSGNVSIGTTSISSKLTVAGNTTLVGSDTNPALIVQSSGAVNLLQVTGVNYPRVLVGNGTDDVFNTLQVFGSGYFQSNVGIGTTSPADRLEIVGGGIILPNNQPLQFRGVGGGTNPILSLSGANRTELRTPGGSAMHLLDGNDINLTINGSGNVGIGTTTPSAKLDVTGTIRSANSNTTGQHNFFQASASGGELLDIRYTEEAAGNTPSNAWQFRSGSIARDIIFSMFDNPALTINTSGNVGIGTTTLNQKLTVSGSVLATGNYYAQSTAPGIWLDETNGSVLKGAYFILDEGDFQVQRRATNFGDYEASPFRISISAPQHAFRLIEDGSVGIGTASPRDKLEVYQGELRVQSCVKNDAGSAISGTCSSDGDLKFVQGSLEVSLEDIVALEPVFYKWRAEEYPEFGFDGDTLNLGLIAQDVDDHIPGLVVENGERGFMALKFQELPFYLLEGLRQLYGRVQDIQAKVDQLLSREIEYDRRLELLEERVRQLEALHNVTHHEDVEDEVVEDAGETDDEESENGADETEPEDLVEGDGKDIVSEDNDNNEMTGDAPSDDQSTDDASDGGPSTGDATDPTNDTSP